MFNINHWKFNSGAGGTSAYDFCAGKFDGGELGGFCLSRWTISMARTIAMTRPKIIVAVEVLIGKLKNPLSTSG